MTGEAKTAQAACMQPDCNADGTELFDSDKGRTYRTCREHWMSTMVGLMEFRVARSFKNFRAVSRG